MAQAFGDRLRGRREELGLSRQAVADRSGLSYAYLTQLESGRKSRPSSKALYALAQGMGVPIEELESMAGSPTSPRGTAYSSLDWYANPQYVASGPVAEMAVAPSYSRRTSTSTGADEARSEVLPAVRRLLAAYPPAVRLALLHDLQAEALEDLGERPRR